jgi:sarcosine oxidase subunit beta
MTRTAGAIVVGGGIIGASTLFQLGVLGVRDALLCEAARPGAGASGASGAFIQLHFCRNEPETVLTLASFPYFQRWSELVGAGDPGFVPSGYLRLEPPERAAILHERVALLQGFGCGTSVITIDEVARLAPYLHTDGLATAAYEPGSGYADAEATLAGFLAAARLHSGTVQSDTTVTGLRERGGAIVGVETSAGPIDAPIVIVAAGVGTVPLLAATGVALPIRPTLTQWLGFTLPDEVPAPAMTIGDGLSQCYFRMIAPGSREILLGIGSTAHRPWPPTPGADMLTPEEMARGATRLAARLRGGEHARPNGGRNGPITLTPDDLPIIDRHPELAGLYLFAGDGGASFKTAPAIGRVLAEWATLGAPRLVDVAAFGLARFGAEAGMAQGELGT